MNERTCIDIFTGVGCFSIAARANRVRTVAMCEIKSDCRNFLAAQWPGVTIHDNAKTFDARPYKGVWLVCGGPPCQPSSLAGAQLGERDHRWLWPQALRIIDEAEPAFVLFENPIGFAGVGLDGVLASLEAKGYETGTVNIPACGINAPHRRERLWIMGYRQSRGLATNRRTPGQCGHADQPSKDCCMGDTASARPHASAHSGIRPEPEGQRTWLLESERSTGGALADSDSERCARSLQPDRQTGQGRAQADQRLQGRSLADSAGLPGAKHGDQPRGGLRRGSGSDHAPNDSGALANGLRDGFPAIGSARQELSDTIASGSLWDDFTWIECGDGKRRRAKPGVCGLVNGPSVGLLEALGNAIVWPIAARIIAAMIQAEETSL